MTQPFDAYHKWLGIPPAEQPPNHYRLLGLALFESDSDVILSAAEQRIAHVRTFQISEHAEASQRVLNELAAARICLLNPQKRAAYDAQLRRRLARPKPEIGNYAQRAAAIRPLRSLKAGSRPRQDRTLLIGTVAVVAVLLTVAAWYGTQSSRKSTATDSDLTQELASSAPEATQLVGRLQPNPPRPESDGAEPPQPSTGADPPAELPNPSSRPPPPSVDRGAAPAGTAPPPADIPAAPVPATTSKPPTTGPSAGGATPRVENGQHDHASAAAPKPRESMPVGEMEKEESAIGRAIDRGVQFLLAKQKPNGLWSDPVRYPGGITDLCALVLLKQGIDPDDARLRLTLTELERMQPGMTYSTALHTLVFCAAGAKAHRKAIERNVEWLVAAQKRQGPFTGAWGYPQAEGDNSNTAFAAWALFEADRVGIEVQKTVWKRTLNYFLENQNPNGSWGYKPKLNGTGSMTSQGMFCVAAAGRVLGEDLPDRPAARSVERAAGWLARNFDIEHNPGTVGGQFFFYYLLALGKASRVSEKLKYGQHEWFGEGSNVLISAQEPDGSWVGTGHAEDDRQLATSMALLFLLLNRDQ